MSGGTVFRGAVRLAGAAAAGAAAAAPSSESLCHFQPPVSVSLREQENLSALLRHSNKDVDVVNTNDKHLESFVNVRFEHGESAMNIRFEQEESFLQEDWTGLRRLIFSTPPTEEEVEEATKELHAAIHISLPAQGFISEPSSPNLVASSEDDLDVTPIMASEGGMATSSPYSQSLNHLGAFAMENSSVMQAFQLLQTNPRVQDVVRSLACDPAIWNAVLHNEKVVQLTQDEDLKDEQGSVDYDDEEDEPEELSSLVLASKVYGYLTTRTKVYYSYMREKISSILANMFGSMEKTLCNKGATSAKDRTAVSCMMLAVAVVIVVVVQRSLRGR